MKTEFSTLFLLVFVLFGRTNKQPVVPDQKAISFYATHSEKTDPEEYTYLYDDLPESLEKLCAIIKIQLIHPL
jgi:hypothetical protein